MITYYFHVSRQSRKKYNFEETFFSTNGTLVVANARAARLLTEKINNVRRKEKNQALITVGELNALGLLHELFHLIIRKYESTKNNGVFYKNLQFLDESLSKSKVDKILLTFIEEFPPLPVYNGKISPVDYLKGKTKNKSNREIVIEELILLNLENLNPAVKNLKEFYTDEVLVQLTDYNKLIEATESFFENEYPVAESGMNLISFLRKPITTNPYSIFEQLEYIRTNWEIQLDEEVINNLLSGKDLIQEDYKIFVQHGGGEKATPPVPTYEYEHDYIEKLKHKFEKGKKLTEQEYQHYQLELEKFTEDTDWMPRVVMIAKNVHVWMFQLAHKYDREIKHLDQIPDEELDTLAEWNFTALWLIGIWERSSASKKIKQMMGNPEASSSAYSLFDYVIAKDLGGEDAFNNLKQRAWLRGIRLASDMVPNHSGIYSKWVVEKPDYFLQSSSPPYPGYRFTGPNLSDDKRVEVRIEDQYYTRTDAAVVFERLDKYTGSRTYIYHGNDGTNMPWNDTAQLNLMKPEVRESLIQTIMHVARKTPVIRFDAAMTLAKKHYQRLWFPIPGSGGAIPSRSDYAMTRSQFDEAMPVEFWREVVDRINSEMPGTLLLAEAFWLMEGYFVRTLGMHRVYNSAFMHMLMKEENEKYKELIKNTLSFNPEILKRYVNFMSNPDEETAINQFGKGDKYFGVATLMVTMPGLPMFAHGQIQGFSEKYGMEYYRSYYNESEDSNLIERHRKEIFPLIRKRYLFSQVENFELYDFISRDGDTNENVIAFTNRSGHERVLILFNNSYSEAFGKIRFSGDKAAKNNSPSNTNIADALGFNSSNQFYYTCQDHITKNWILLSGENASSEGLNFHLNGYQVKVIMGFRELYDQDGSYKKLYQHLNGRAVESIEHALLELNLSPFHHSLINLFSSKNINSILPRITKMNDEDPSDSLINDLKDTANKLSHILSSDSKGFSEINIKDLISNLFKNVESYVSTYRSFNNSKRKPKWFSKVSEHLPDFEKSESQSEMTFFIIYYLLKQLLESEVKKSDAQNCFQELMLWKPLFEIFSYLELSERSETYYNLLIVLQSAEIIPAPKNPVKKDIKLNKKSSQIDMTGKDDLYNYFKTLFEDKVTSDYLMINEYQDLKYYNKERFDELIKWLIIISCMNSFNSKDLRSRKSRFKQYSELIEKLQSKSEESGFKVAQFLESLKVIS